MVATLSGCLFDTMLTTGVGMRPGDINYNPRRRSQLIMTAYYTHTYIHIFQRHQHIQSTIHHQTVTNTSTQSTAPPQTDTTISTIRLHQSQPHQLANNHCTANSHNHINRMTTPVTTTSTSKQSLHHKQSQPYKPCDYTSHNHIN